MPFNQITLKKQWVIRTYFRDFDESSLTRPVQFLTSKDPSISPLTFFQAYYYWPMHPSLQDQRTVEKTSQPPEHV